MATATSLAPNSTLWLTPGHTQEDATLVVRADDAVYAMTHLWWKEDRTPEIDPLGDDQAAIEVGRARVLAAADIVDPRPRRRRFGSTAEGPPRDDVQSHVVDDRLVHAVRDGSDEGIAVSGAIRSRWAPRTTVRR